MTLATATVGFQMQAQKAKTEDKFEQLKEELATPNVYRTASGAPGHEYYQQKADYDMQIELDDAKQQIRGSEKITYTNNSPDELRYLWVQLDQNRRAKDSDSYKIATSTLSDEESIYSIRGLLHDFDGGFKLEEVVDASGKSLAHTVNKTMMRIDLPTPLKPNASFSFRIKWWYNINNRMTIGGRSGYEYFEEEDNYLYTIAQFFPRMAVYNEVEGWQNKQFLGRGEFTLPFGDYKVSITVPSDHVVASTGTLQNAKDVLSSKERKRLEEAKTAKKPVLIVTEEEAREAEKDKAKGTKTWVYSAKNVRDFAFASSRKFMWDAMGVKFGSRTVMAMSYYPKEGNPLWEQYSTEVVAHTLRTYSKFTFDYPYPKAISVHAASIGMEYPMICFNGGRPEADGTYGARTKHGMISVIIHEVGHNYFPMIVNSDERQWTWMDEGLNTFVQFLTEQEWDHDYPSRRGAPRNIVDYMKGDPSNISPIMTNSESVYQFGNNAYGKPATALNILRETIMGRELFDFAFKEYSRRWMFKHPSPADFFRTMEDASGVDLDWFWRGWFYSTDHVDISLDEVRWYQMDTGDPTVDNPKKKAVEEAIPEDISYIRNQEDIKETMVEKNPELNDFYNKYDRYEVTYLDKKEYEEYAQTLTEEEQAALAAGYHFYEMKFTNKGGLVMPLILELQYADGTTEMRTIPAEIWRFNRPQISKVIVTEKPVKQIRLDPHQQTADTDLSNNSWPRLPVPSRFKLYKSKNYQRSNPMQRAKKNSEQSK